MNKLGEDIITMYKPYRNLNTNWTVATVAKQKFEIDRRYEILDVRIDYSMQWGKEPMESSSQLKIPVPRPKKSDSSPSRKYSRLLNTRYLRNAPSGSLDFTGYSNMKIS
jgi:hypothetical protein